MKDIDIVHHQLDRVTDLVDRIFANGFRFGRDALPN